MAAEHLTHCPKCAARLRWAGSLVDQPRCACGHLPPREQLERDQRAVEDLLAPLLAQEPTRAR